MIIKSKKTQVTQEIPQSQWALMIKRGDNRKYEVIDGTDEHLNVTTVGVEPVSLVDDSKEEEPVEEKAFDNEDEEYEFIKEYLDKKGVSYHWNTGIEKLRKLYEENL